MSVIHSPSRTHDVYLYKSVKIPSCEGRVVRVKYESLGQTTCCWVGQNKYNQVGGMCKHGKSSLNQGQGQDGRIREVLRRIAAQVCMNVYNKPIIFPSSLQNEECNAQGTRMIWIPMSLTLIQHRHEQLISQ